jgi:hypothetical protein
MPWDAEAPSGCTSDAPETGCEHGDRWTNSAPSPDTARASCLPADSASPRYSAWHEPPEPLRPTARSGPAAPRAEDPPHSRLTDLVAEADQLAVYPAVSPAGFFPASRNTTLAALADLCRTDAVSLESGSVGCRGKSE